VTFPVTCTGVALVTTATAVGRDGVHAAGCGHGTGRGRLQQLAQRAGTAAQAHHGGDLWHGPRSLTTCYHDAARQVLQ